MAVIEIDNFNLVADWNSITVPCGEDIPTGRRGKVMNVDDSGEAVTSAGDTAADVGGIFRGISLNSQKYNGDSVTILRWGLVDLGSALDEADPGDPVYIADEDSESGARGEMSLTVGDSAEAAIVGYVWPDTRADGTVGKMLYVDCLRPHVSPA